MKVAQRKANNEDCSTSIEEEGLDQSDDESRELVNLVWRMIRRKKRVNKKDILKNRQGV